MSGHSGWTTAQRSTGLLAAVAVLLAVLVPAPLPWLLPLTALAAVASAFVLRPQLRGVDRAGWLLAGCSQLVVAVVAALVVLAPRPSWGSAAPLEAALLMAVLLQVAGLSVLMLASARPTRAWSLAVDALLVVGGAFVVAWVLGWQRLLPGASEPVQQLSVGFGRAAIAVELVGLAVGAGVWFSRRGGERLGPRLMVLGALSATVADTGLLAALGLVPRWTATGWVLASALLVVGPAWAAGRGGLPRRTLDHERALVPVVALVGAATTVALIASPQGLPRAPLLVSGAVMLVLLARLLDVVRTNQGLAQALAVRERHFRSMVDSTHDVMLRLDLDGRVGYVSPSAQRLLRLDPGAVRGLLVTDVLSEPDAALVRRALAALRADPAAVQRVQVSFSGGEPSDREPLQLEAIANRVGSDVVVAVRDVTETVALREKLLRVAYTDPLTSLPNRAAFELALEARAAGVPGAHGVPPRSTGPSSEGAEQLVVLFCDLDGFKRINDSHGHAVGDALLAEAGARVAAAVGSDDLACRIGGDEFTVLLRRGADVALAVQVAERVRDAIARPFATADVGELVLGVSIGVAAGDGSRPPSDLVRDADVAMYQAKHAGRGQVKVFEPRMYDVLARSVDLEQRLHTAVQERALSVVYQPVIDLRSGAVISAEALLRWRDGDQLVIEADELVALAEASGDIHAIGQFVLEEAVARAAAWAASGYPVRVAVNLSAHQVGDPALVSSVDRVLRAQGVPADRLTLEITESSLLDQTDVTLARMEALRGLGVHLAIDDFGTGYSSLDYLRRLPVDQIKIDRSFLKGFGAQDDVTALVRAVIGLGHDLGLSVTVEGVESGLHVRLLREAGAQQAQGYVFARALDEASMQECLRSGPFSLDVADAEIRLPRVAERSWSPLGPPAGPHAVPAARRLVR